MRDHRVLRLQGRRAHTDGRALPARIPWLRQRGHSRRRAIGRARAEEGGGQAVRAGGRGEQRPPRRLQRPRPHPVGDPRRADIRELTPAHRLPERGRRRTQRHRGELRRAESGAPGPRPRIHVPHGQRVHPAPDRVPHGRGPIAGGGGQDDRAAHQGRCRRRGRQPAGAGEAGRVQAGQRRRAGRRLRRGRDLHRQRPARPAAPHAHGSLPRGRRDRLGDRRRGVLPYAGRLARGQGAVRRAVRPGVGDQGRLQALHAEGDQRAARGGHRFDAGQGLLRHERRRAGGLPAVGPRRSRTSAASS